MNIQLPTCACGCGVLLFKRTTGPAPRYASAACRKRAERRRKASDELVPIPELVHAQPQHVSTDPVEVQVSRAILEARAVAFAFLRLGAQAHPSLGWRCTVVGQAIVEQLGESFGKETTE